MVRAEGIEPTTKRWQRLILPLNYARNVLETRERLELSLGRFAVNRVTFPPPRHIGPTSWYRTTLLAFSAPRFHLISLGWIILVTYDEELPFCCSQSGT